MTSRRIAVAAVGVLVLVAAIFGFTQRGASSLDTAATEAVERESQSDTPRTLPDFTGSLFGGGTLASADIEGPAVIKVYGSWCPSCQAEAPAFAQLQNKHPALNYYFIAVNDSEANAADFVQRYDWKPAPTIDDADREVEEAFGLSGQPHTIFMDAEGSIAVHRGPGSFGDLNTLAEQIA